MEVFLREACSDDAALRDKVAALLAALEASEGLLPEEPLRWAEGLEKSHEQPGQWLGHYRLLERIGEGGFGVVWKAEQEEPVRRLVALKILKPGFDSRAIVARFVLERQAMAMLAHPHVAHVYDAGMTPGGRPFFVMEYLEGEPLLAYAEARGLGVAERAALMIAVIGAVQHAHQKGVIHRDLKPSNIIVVSAADGPAPKVIDFGIAKLVDAPAEHTLAGAPWGTPAFMSPEQRAGGAVDTRSDIFSLGKILAELLKERERERGDLTWVVEKATEADPAARYESAAAFRDDLERWRRHEPTLAGPPSHWRRARKFIRRHKGPLAATAAVFVALAAGLAASLWQGRRAAAANAALEETLYHARLTEARALRRSGKAGQREKAWEALAAAARHRPAPEVRDEALSTLALPEVREVAELDVLPERLPVCAYDFASDLLLIARQDAPGVERWRLRGRTPLGPLPLSESWGGVFKMMLSEGGNILALMPAGRDTLVFYDTETGRELSRIVGVDAEGNGCCFRDSGERALISLRDGGLAEISPRDSLVRRRWPRAERFDNFSTGTDRALAVSFRDKKALLLRDDRPESEHLILSEPSLTVAALAPDRPLVAWGSATGNVHVQEYDGLASLSGLSASWKGHGDFIQTLGFCGGSRYLVTGSWDDTVRVWLPHGHEVLRMDGVLTAISPRGDALIVQRGRRLLLVDFIAPAEVASVVQTGRGVLFRGSFSPDGGLYAAPGKNGTLLCRSADGHALAQWGAGHLATAFLPDGRLVTSGADGVNVHPAPPAGGSFARWDTHGPTRLQRDVSHKLALDHAGRLLASFTGEHAPPSARHINVFALGDQSLVRALPWQAANVTDLVLDPGGRWLAASYWRGRGCDVWSTGDWSLKLQAEPGVASVRLAASPDGRWLLTSTPHELALWETGSWRCARRVPWPTATSWASPVAWSPQGRLAVLTGRNAVEFLTAPGLLSQGRLTLPGGDNPSQLIFSPNGETLAVCAGPLTTFLHLDLIRQRLASLGLEF